MCQQHWHTAEYNDTQCDKRNSYRHRVKAEKAEKTGTDGTGEGDDAVDATDASLLAAQLNGVANGHADAGDDGERPAKKFKGTGGHVVITPGEPIDEDDVEDFEAEADVDDGEDDDEEVDDDEPEDDDGNDDEEAEDETMEGMDEPEMDGRGGLRDEALDGNESD
jgi:DNA polymerase epsilon subunit 3